MGKEMSKQEEIREGIDRTLFALEAGEISVFEAKQKLSDLGCVLKVDRELPSIMTLFGGLKHAGTYQREMLEAGYVAVEPLIEVEK